MKTVSRKSLTEAATQSIRSEITSGRWAVGEQLPNEAQLSARLGVSRGTVREAVRALVAQGMLETRQGSGTYVRSKADTARSLNRIRHTSLRDRLEMRAALEVEAARLAAQVLLGLGPDAMTERLDPARYAPARFDMVGAA